MDDHKQATSRVNKMRRKVLPKIDSIGCKVGLKFKEEVPDNKILDTIEMNPNEVEELFKDIGLKREPIAVLKVRDDGRMSCGSWKFIPDNREMQVHVTIFPSEGGTEVYTHYEYRWEPWTTPMNFRRPQHHYYPQKEYDVEKGEKLFCEILTEQVDEDICKACTNNEGEEITENVTIKERIVYAQKLVSGLFRRK